MGRETRHSRCGAQGGARACTHRVPSGAFRLPGERVGAVGFADDISVRERSAANNAGWTRRVLWGEVHDEMEERQIVRPHPEVGMPLEDVALERMSLRGKSVLSDRTLASKGTPMCAR